MSDVIIVGAGIGGLASAIALASRGLEVEIFERAATPGGKAATVEIDGVEVDTGPSVLTLPGVFDTVFRLAGSTLAEQVRLLSPDPAFRYLYPDGTQLDVRAEVEDTVAGVRRTLGEDAAAQLTTFLAHTGRIWEAAAPHFVFGDAPTFGGILRLGGAGLSAMRRIDPLRSMWRAITETVEDERLTWLLARYATYNGSSPLLAPATLNCIAHVELASGAFGVEGGIYALTRALLRAATGLGVRLHLEASVERILLEGGAVSGVVVAGEVVPCRAVVANADAAHVAEVLLPPEARRPKPGAPPSMSGWTGIVRARRRPPAARPAHQVLFPEAYLEEFRDIFDRDRPPASPTVYLCAQEKAHGRRGWDHEEPLFVMANAPPEPAHGARDAEVHHALGARVMARLREAELIAPGDPLVWSRTPRELALAFPGSRGSIYGAASNALTAAFRRPPNRIAPGLYLASGSAHPGGGLPLAALSGLAAARALLRDRGQPSDPELTVVSPSSAARGPAVVRDPAPPGSLESTARWGR